MTIALTLTRLTPGGPWMFLEPGGQAKGVVVTQKVVEPTGGARLTVFDLDDVELFHVEAYAAVDRGGWGVFDAGSTPLATYVREDGVFILREAASAPVASVRPNHSRWEIVEIGGESLGFCWREAQVFSEVIDERYGLVVFDRPSLLDGRALMAAPLVLWLETYRGPRPRPTSREGDEGGPGEVGRALEVVLRMSK